MADRADGGRTGPRYPDNVGCGIYQLSTRTRVTPQMLDMQTVLALASEEFGNGEWVVRCTCWSILGLRSTSGEALPKDECTLRAS